VKVETLVIRPEKPKRRIGVIPARSRQPRLVGGTSVLWVHRMFFYGLSNGGSAGALNQSAFPTVSQSTYTPV